MNGIFHFGKRNDKYGIICDGILTNEQKGISGLVFEGGESYNLREGVS
jgi:hypothetical protein